MHLHLRTSLPFLLLSFPFASSKTVKQCRPKAASTSNKVTTSVGNPTPSIALPDASTAPSRADITAAFSGKVDFNTSSITSPIATPAIPASSSTPDKPSVGDTSPAGLKGFGTWPGASTSGTATTTRYFDHQKGACGCGGPGEIMAEWQKGYAEKMVYTAAGSPALFGPGTWLGPGCGFCYELTAKAAVDGGSQGKGAATGTKITVMVTNLCPTNGNEQWCPTPPAKNKYGMSAHFDIMLQDPQVGSIPWDNPIVDYKLIQCPDYMAQNNATCYVD
ncbi:hypothetical protein PYCC9005_001108 [Savitreella phatthalungensis]